MGRYILTQIEINKNYKLKDQALIRIELIEILN